RLVPAFLAAQAAAGRPVAALLRGAEGQRYTKGLRAAGYRPGPPLEHVAIDFDDPLRAEHRALFARLDDGRLNTIEIVQGPPGDHPDAARLLTAYLTAHPDHVLGAVDVAFALAQPRTCLLARDADGDARALVVLTLGPRVMLDVLYGCGSPRQHVLAVLLALRTIDRELDRDVDFFPMSPQVAALARRLGGRTRTRVEAWLPG
ncbi:MAG: hypothetical protein KC549_12100, partial [Myxococcales bacterium]|nr:hypothetical protein [Myxococcales bacterium]